jgi:hypothetical protein
MTNLLQEGREEIIRLVEMMQECAFTLHAFTVRLETFKEAERAARQMLRTLEAPLPGPLDIPDDFDADSVAEV